MARVYVSCSEEDLILSNRIKDWMRLQNYEPITLNDQINSKKEGWATWQKSLAQTLEFCDAVILILTPEWTNSKWCFAEFTKAYSMGKTIFAVIEKPLQENFSEPDILVFDLTEDRDDALARLSIGLRDALPQAGETFGFDSDRPVYPGLQAFIDKDHSVFFSRDDDVRRIIDRLNTRRRQGGARLLALLGASGTGISSLLMAGVIPRIQRDHKNWIILSVIRPQLKPVEELAKAVANMFGRPERWNDWYTLFWGNEFKEVAREMAEQLRERYKQPLAQILLPIDQGEELFSISDPQEAQRFLDILGAIFDDDMPYLGVVALRPDFLAAFQTADQLSHIVEEFSPRLMPLSSIRNIVTGPERITHVEIEDRLVDAIIRDAAQEGALPLVGYTLRYLYEQSSNSGKLYYNTYESIGAEYAGKTPLGNIVARAAEELLEADNLSSLELQKIKEFFTKTLLWRDIDNRYVVRPVSFAKLDIDIKALAKKFIDHGLLVRRDIDGTSIIEYAHLAVLQYWPRLESWLEAPEDNVIEVSEEEIQEKKQSHSHKKDDDVLDLTLDAKIIPPQEMLDVSEDSIPKEGEILNDKVEPPVRKPKIYDNARENQNNNKTRTIEPTEPSIRNEERDDKVDVGVLANFKPEQKGAFDDDFVIGIDDNKAKSTVLKQLALFVLIAILGVLIGLYWPAIKKFAGLENITDRIANVLPVDEKAKEAPETKTQEPPKEEAPKKKEVAKLPSLNDLQQNTVSPSKKNVPPKVLLRKAVQKIEEKKPILGILLAYEVLNAREASEQERESAKLYITSALSNLDESFVLQGHSGEILDIAFSKNSHFIATASDDKTVRIWDLVTKETISVLKGHTGPVHSISFTPDGKRIASASSDGTVRTWRVSDGRLLQRLTGHRGEVTSVMFNQRGDRLASASKDKEVRIWYPYDGQLEFALKGHTEEVTDVNFSANGKWVATGSLDQTARIWDAFTGNALFILQGHKGPIRSVSFTSDSALLVTTSDDHTVKIWSSSTGKLVYTFQGHSEGVQHVSLSQQNDYIISTSQNAKTLLWDRRNGKVLTDFKAYEKATRKAMFSEDGNWIGLVAKNNSAYVLPAKLLTDRRVFEGHTDRVFSAQFSQDDQLIITTSKDNTVRVWNTSTGEQRALLTGHVNQVHHGEFSPDKKIIATASRDKTIRLWNAVNGEDIKVLEGHESDVNRIAFSPDGKFLASASNDSTVRIWDINTGKVKHILKGHEGKVWSVLYSKDGKRVITASQDKTVRIWDAMSGSEVSLLEGHKAAVSSLAISPDGSTLASASIDRTVRFWDALSSRPLPQLLLHNDSVLSVGYSQDGKQVITGGFNKIASIWDVKTTKKIYEFKDHSDKVLSSTMSSNGNWALTVSSENVRLWRLFSSVNELSFYVASLIPRCLDRDERVALDINAEFPFWCKRLEELHASR